MPWLHFYEKKFTKNRDSTVYAWSGSYCQKIVNIFSVYFHDRVGTLKNENKNKNKIK